MWMEIEDKITKYLINANSYNCIRKGTVCTNESTIIFYNGSGEDLILSWKTEKERDDIYQKIIDFLQVMQGKRLYGN